MAALSAKLRSIEFGKGGSGVAFWCPGCGRSHAIRVDRGQATGGSVWTWDGNVDAPTFAPSVLVRIEWSKSMEPGDNPAEWQDEVCHSFVRAGIIEFLGDCTHALSGQSVPIPDWPDMERRDRTRRHPRAC